MSKSGIKIKVSVCGNAQEKDFNLLLNKISLGQSGATIPVISLATMNHQSPITVNSFLITTVIGLELPSVHCQRILNSQEHWAPKLLTSRFSFHV